MEKDRIHVLCMGKALLVSMLPFWATAVEDLVMDESVIEMSGRCSIIVMLAFSFYLALDASESARWVSR